MPNGTGGGQAPDEAARGLPDEISHRDKSGDKPRTAPTDDVGDPYEEPREFDDPRDIRRIGRADDVK